MLTGFFDLAMEISFVMKDSSLDPFLMRSISKGFLLGRNFTACDSKRIKKAPTNIAVYGRLRFRRKFLVFLRKLTMHGGGFIPKHNSCCILDGCFQNLDGLEIFLERMDLLHEFPLVEVEPVTPETLVAACWGQDGLVESLEVSGSIWTEEELSSVLTVADVGPGGGQ